MSSPIIAVDSTVPGLEVACGEAKLIFLKLLARHDTQKLCASCFWRYVLIQSKFRVLETELEEDPLQSIAYDCIRRIDYLDHLNTWNVICKTVNNMCHTHMHTHERVRATIPFFHLWVSTEPRDCD